MKAPRWLTWRRAFRWAWIVVFVVFIEPTTIGFFILRDRAVRANEHVAGPVCREQQDVATGLVNAHTTSRGELQ